MVGFSALDKKQNWDGKLVSGNTVKEERDSILICLDGSPVVENQQLSIFDYGNLDAGIEYEVDVVNGKLEISFDENLASGTIFQNAFFTLTEYGIERTISDIDTSNNKLIITTTPTLTLKAGIFAVSYTHLTLPTKRIV